MEAELIYQKEETVDIIVIFSYVWLSGRFKLTYLLQKRRACTFIMFPVPSREFKLNKMWHFNLYFFIIVMCAPPPLTEPIDVMEWLRM